MPKRASTRRSIKNIHRYSPIPAIYKCPIEIFDEIFSMACTDGGETGRSLSTVSKRICEVSKVFKYRTLHVKQHQLRPLARVLRSLPLDARRVVHLFILPPDLGQPFFASQRDRFFDIDKNRVLALVAHSLRTLKVATNHAQLLLPITLPFLWDLTMHSALEVVEKCTKRKKACYPALKRFHFTHYRFWYKPNIISLVVRNAPTLEIFKLTCHPSCQHEIEDFLEKPTSLKIVCCSLSVGFLLE